MKKILGFMARSAILASFVLGFFATGAEAMVAFNFGSSDPGTFADLHNALFPYSPTTTQGTSRSQGFQGTVDIGRGAIAGVKTTMERATMATGNEFALDSMGVMVQQQLINTVGLAFFLARARAMGGGATNNGTILAVTMSVALLNNPLVALQITRYFLQVDAAGNAQSTGIALSVAPGQKGPGAAK
jgi:hypothetical protein